MTLFFSQYDFYTVCSINFFQLKYHFSNNILNAFAENVYLRTHTRMSPYLLGIFMGFVLRSYNNSKSSNLTKVLEEILMMI